MNDIDKKLDTILLRQLVIFKKQLELENKLKPNSHKMTDYDSCFMELEREQNELKDFIKNQRNILS